ncbi:hypothetical protein DMENIID0001_105860 [Sergentomyia squamirostris]
MENADENINPEYTYIEDSGGVIEDVGEIAHAREEIVQNVDFTETALSKLIDALDKLAKIHNIQKHIADVLEIVPESQEDLDSTVTFPLKGLKEFQDLERLCKNDTYRRNLTKSLRVLLSGPSQDPIKNLLDDSIVMYFSWDDLTVPYVISLRHTISFGHVIYNALGMGFADYSNYVQGCLELAQAKSENNDISTVNRIRADSQLQNFAYVVSDISQRISDLEIFQKRIESFTCLKRQEIDPRICFPINSMRTLEALEGVLQSKVIQKVVISHCKELYEGSKTLENIMTLPFLAEFSMNGEHSSVDIFSFKFINHALFMAMGISREDYQIKIMDFIQSASENLSINSQDTTQSVEESPPGGKKLVTHKKIMLINKKDLSQQVIPKKFKDILRNEGRATFFTDDTNFISFSRLDSEAKKTNISDDLEEKFSRYFPLTSQKSLRTINIKLTDDHFKAVLQTTLDDFYNNRKFSIKDIVSDDFLVKVDEDNFFNSHLMIDFLPLILSLPSKSFLKMAKFEFRALKSAFELRENNRSELISLEVELGQTIPASEKASEGDNKVFPIASIEDFDNIERNLQYSEYHKEISNTCKIILMKNKKFKLTNFVKEEILMKYSAKGSVNTLSLMETTLFGDILKKFSKLEEPQFITILQKHHLIVLNKLKNSQASQKFAENTNQESGNIAKTQEDSGTSGRRKRKFVEVIFPLETQEELILVNEKLQDKGFRLEIEKVLKDIIYESCDVFPLESVLGDNLLRKYTWNDETSSECSLKQYPLFRDVIFNILKIEWSTYDQLMQKSLYQTVIKGRECEMRASEGPVETNNFHIIPPLPLNTQGIEQSVVTVLPNEEKILITIQQDSATEMETEVEVEESLPAPSVSVDDETEEDSYIREDDTSDDNSNLNGFEHVLPIKTKEEFLQLECLLADKHFSTYFSLLCNSCSDISSLLSYIITSDALRYFSWNGSENTMKFQGTNLCNLLLSKNTSVNSLKAIMDSVREDATDKDVITLFPIASKEDLRTVESYLPHIKTKMVTHFRELREEIGNEVFSRFFSQELLNNLSRSDLDSLPKCTFFKEVIQEVFKDMKKSQIMTTILGEVETPDEFFSRILPVNEMNLGLFEQRLKQKEYVESLINICLKLMEGDSNGYFHKLIDSDLIQQYSLNSDEGMRSIEKSMLYNSVLKEIYKKCDVDLQTRVQIELYRAQALADYKSK